MAVQLTQWRDRAGFSPTSRSSANLCTVSSRGRVVSVSALDKPSERLTSLLGGAPMGMVRA